MHSDLMYSYYNVPYPQDHLMALWQDQSHHKLSLILSLKRSLQKHLFLQIHFLFFLSRCLSQPFQFLHLLLEDIKEFQLPDYQMDLIILLLLHLRYPLYLQLLKLLVRYFLISIQIFYLWSGCQMSWSSSGYNLLFRYRLGTFQTLLQHRAPFHLLISNGHILPVLSDNQYLLHVLLLLKLPDTDVRYSIFEECDKKMLPLISQKLLLSLYFSMFGMALTILHLY